MKVLFVLRTNQTIEPEGNIYSLFLQDDQGVIVKYSVSEKWISTYSPFVKGNLQQLARSGFMAVTEQEKELIKIITNE